MHVKRGDTVKVIAGKDKGKEGKVVAAIPSQNKVIVEGVAVAKRHQKARVQGQESGIINKEMPINASNVMRVCPKCGKAARVGIKVFEDGSKARYCKKCGETFND
ncbi:MAG: 50S ribosomal protein L24 [Oscillospiraceae bacterium]|nr:50S ribosomal protein L24 [Oscillospiraceae bacterium]